MPTLAEPITLQSDDGGVHVSGDFVAFDGSVITLNSEAGTVSVRLQGLQCFGAACPGKDYVPEVRFAGAASMADLLLPALFDAYARDRGLVVEISGTSYTFREGEKTLFAAHISPGTTALGLEAMLAFEADMVLADRELSGEELQRAMAAGFGSLDTTRQSHIVALDAVVPAVQAGSDRIAISFQTLVAVLNGESDMPVHLLSNTDGKTSSVIGRILDQSTQRLRGDVVYHREPADIEAALAEDENAIALLPVSEISSAQSLSLGGACGIRMEADFLTMKTEDYALTTPMLIYHPPWRLHPAIQDFLTWTRSAQAQLVVRRAGMADLAGVPIPLSAQGDRLANAILNAGSDVTLSEIQRMMRVLSPRVRISTTFRFEPGSTQLDGQSRANVMQVSQAIHDGRYVGRELLLVGFSDGRGPALANRDLSSARAESVKEDILNALGGVLPFNVALDTDAFGEALPVACDDTLWGQQANRRVELWVRDLR